MPHFVLPTIAELPQDLLLDTFSLRFQVLGNYIESSEH
jgi:hypothetical protein